MGKGATDEVIGKFIDGIEEYRTGQFGSKDVTTEVDVVSQVDYPAIKVPERDGRAFMRGIGGASRELAARTPRMDRCP